MHSPSRLIFPLSSQGDNKLSETLLDRLHATRRVFLSNTVVRGVYVIRLATGSIFTKESDVRAVWRLIQETATQLLTS